MTDGTNSARKVSNSPNLKRGEQTMPKPNINVTPLIDVLLVLLIIFMVVTPLKPSNFKARVPSESKAEGTPGPDTLVIAVERDESLRINNESGLGTVDDTNKLVERLRQVFAERGKNGNVSASFADDPNRPYSDKIERTVFIKAPRSAGYGTVARVVDAAKQAGAYPISLQIDDLDS
jgi:biopolymer transport protein ExbD